MDASGLPSLLVKLQWKSERQANFEVYTSSLGFFTLEITRLWERFDWEVFVEDWSDYPPPKIVLLEGSGSSFGAAEAELLADLRSLVEALQTTLDEVSPAPEAKQ